jgi:hypothetical protein
MKIHISNNWCNTEQFFVYKLLKKYFNNDVELTSDPINCDIFIHSVFGNDDYYKTTKAKFKIFCLWETRFYLDIAKERIQYSDLSLTYMPTEGKNIRFPLWYMWIDWWNENGGDEVTVVCGQSHHYIGKNTLKDEWVPTINNIKTNIYTSGSVWNRNKFCSMLVGNCEESSVKVRSEIFNEVSKNIEPVFGMGLAFGKRFEGNKIDLLTNFKFNLCYENSVHEGYVSEKLFDAKFAGCIPLYYGDPIYSQKDFNKNSFLNRLDYSNNTDYIKEIKKLNSDKEYFISKCNEPLFTEDKFPSLDFFYEKFDEVFK